MQKACNPALKLDKKFFKNNVLVCLINYTQNSLAYSVFFIYMLCGFDNLGNRIMIIKSPEATDQKDYFQLWREFLLLIDDEYSPGGKRNVEFKEIVCRVRIIHKKLLNR